jgi:hypothetical protein
MPQFNIILFPTQRVDEQSGVEVAAGAGGTSVVLLMVRDAYANYVVQTALDVVTEGVEKESLLEELRAHSTELVSYSLNDLRFLYLRSPSFIAWCSTCPV